MTPAIKALLDAIGKHEAPKGYGQIYSGAKGVPRGTDVSKLRLKEVQALQKAMLAAGSKSTASGRYQFISKTLNTTIKEMGLNGEEIWTPDLQDHMAFHLMLGRGLARFQRGEISREQFATNLAKEWASLPVPQDTFNGKRTVKAGQSYYAGDGLNKAFHKPEVILALLDAIRSEGPQMAPQPVSPVPATTGSKPEKSPPVITPVVAKPSWWAWLARLVK